MPILLEGIKGRKSDPNERLNTESKLKNTEEDGDKKVETSVTTSQSNKSVEIFDKNTTEDEDEGLCCICDEKKSNTILECFVII